MHPYKRASGQSMVEFIIVTPVMFLLVFGSIQFALLYQAKTTLNYAVFEAARAGALNSARTTAMQSAFARAMAAMYMDSSIGDSAGPERTMAASDKVYREITGDGSAKPLADFQILNPTRASYADHGVDNTDKGICEIPSDNLMYRDAAVRAQSRQTIQDANLLKLRVVYCYPLQVPFVDRILTTILTEMPSSSCPYCAGGAAEEEIERTCLDAGRFPLNAQAVVRMQSPATMQGACP